ncbi:MAG: hypothetical protein AAF202_13650, partial [Pseudomonadota bacterium]
EIDHHRQSIAELKSKITELQTESQVLRERSSEFESVKSQLAEANAKVAVFEKQSDSLKAGLAKVDQELDSLSDQRKEMSLNEENMRSEFDRLKSRESQMSQFTKQLDDQKVELKKFAKRLAYEMKTSKAFHPLRSLLKLTEAEISKLEVKLSRTAPLAVERASLQEQFEKLVHQRDMIKKSIAQSEIEIEKQATEVVALTQRSVLVPLPPLPPKKK